MPSSRSLKWVRPDDPADAASHVDVRADVADHVDVRADVAEFVDV
jgi:hypothetical protein